MIAATAKITPEKSARLQEMTAEFGEKKIITPFSVPRWLLLSESSLGQHTFPFCVLRYFLGRLKAISLSRDRKGDCAANPQLLLN
jgi:hypothetical protein